MLVDIPRPVLSASQVPAVCQRTPGSVPRVPAQVPAPPEQTTSEDLPGPSRPRPPRHQDHPVAHCHPGCPTTPGDPQEPEGAAGTGRDMAPTAPQVRPHTGQADSLQGLWEERTF